MARNTVSTSSRTMGFDLPFDGLEARRQLHLSLGLVAVLATAIVSAGVAIGGHPLSARQDVVASRAPVAAMQAEVRVSGAKPI